MRRSLPGVGNPAKLTDGPSSDQSSSHDGAGDLFRIWGDPLICTGAVVGLSLAGVSDSRPAATVVGTRRLPTSGRYRSWGVSRASSPAAPLPLPCRGGHLGAGANCFGMRGHQVTQPRRDAITRLVGAQCYRARVSVTSISEVSR
jgi:hypothetical protein